MAVLTLRSNKGSALLNSEVDGNFTYLDDSINALDLLVKSKVSGATISSTPPQDGIMWIDSNTGIRYIRVLAGSVKHWVEF